MVRWIALLVIGLGLLFATGASAQSVKCKLHYNLKGWSIFYKTADGDGRITCNNGESANVRLQARGGGFSFGRSEVIDGKGDFSAVTSIDQLFGGYAQAEAHAGAGRSTDARAMTKGNVVLSLAGTGEGTNFGISFGSFRIIRK